MAFSQVRSMNNASYQAKIKQELAQFKEVENIHDLPDIYHYWSNKYLTPMMMELGFSTIDEFYAKYLLESAERSNKELPRFVSIGAGNCDTELRVAKLLRGYGLTNFMFECLELNPHMLVRGREDALAQGIAEYMLFIEADLNTWQPTAQYSGVIANHSLHHVVNLEGLFDSIKASLEPTGYFVTSDMIGRNGHQRWPEALARVNEFWQELPHNYQYNHLLQRHEPTYINWDCSSEGFEGIRAQDILPLLIERFDFQLFLGFANVVTPFIDRCFGHNFDASAEWDRDFIDRVHAVDENGFRSGEIKPTQMLAVMTPGPAPKPVSARGIMPTMAVRALDGSINH